MHDTTSTKSDGIVVFQILRDTVCAECGQELGNGQLLRLEQDHPLCLSCADLAHLVFLPRGDAALTRRAGRYSTLKAVVVRFSRARTRYERQAVLVEEQALARAEAECLADAGSTRTIGARLRNTFRELYPRRSEANAMVIAQHESWS